MCSEKNNKLEILTEYVDFLRNYQCLNEETINIRRRFIKPFLFYLGEIAKPSKLCTLSPSIIHDYVIASARPLHRASKKHLTSTMRSFLRFAYIKGYLKHAMVEVVPVIPTRKLDRLPQGISWEDVQKLLTMPDKNTPIGRRDFAILLLLASYGVRIGQVTSLQLKDIHWQNGSIHFTGCKHSNALQLPLHKNVAEALLEYIKKDRGKACFPEVFLTIKDPLRPLGKQNHYYYSLKKYYLKANINTPSKGSRFIRHAFATRLVELKTPIKTIADLLGHRCIETTFIYTKVNVVQLRELTLDWPEVLS